MTDDANELMRQAEAWHARLMAPDCTGAERAAFERWRARSPLHARAHAATERLLADVDTLVVEDPRMAALMQRARAGTLAPARRRGRMLAMAAGIVVAVAAGAWWGMGMLGAPPAPTVAYAAADALRSIQLDDGSTVQLDVAGRFTARYDDRSRSIQLEQGRALFEVAHDGDRPFTVRVGKVDVTALGTRFQVVRDGGAVSVMLAEGSVMVARIGSPGLPDRRVQLHPGERLVWTEGQADWITQVADVEVESGWSRGRLIFRGAPLSQVVREVNRYSSRRLVLEDASLGDLPVHGNFVAGDVERVVVALGAVLPVSVEEGVSEVRLRRR